MFRSNTKILFKIHKRGVSDNIYPDLLGHERTFFTNTTLGQVNNVGSHHSHI